MDINEIDIRMEYRHPWELSRARDVLHAIGAYMKNGAVVIDLGAGDQFFDDALLDRYPAAAVNAVDIGYGEETLRKLKGRVRHPDRIRTARALSGLENVSADLALMMDSLEYMEDEAECLKELSSYIKPGGTLVLTVPAFRFLFSRFDRDVSGRCRYGKKDIRAIVSRVPSLRIDRMHYFYTSLFCIRFIQKFSHMKIDPDHKVISGWPYPENAFATKLVKGVLLIDYRVNALLGRAHLDLPGLSLLVVCRKDGV